MISTHPDEFGDTQQRLLESARENTEGQFIEAEQMVTKRFPRLSGDARTHVVVAVVQVIATNYLAAATIRNLPKG